MFRSRRITGQRPGASKLVTVVGIAVLVLLFLHYAGSPASLTASTSPRLLPVTDYDLPTLLNVHSFADLAVPTDGSLVAKAAAREAAARPKSLLAFYREYPPGCSRQPFMPHLQSALKSYAASRSPRPDDNLVQEDDTLVVHFVSCTLYSNGTSLTADFLEDVANRAARFSTVVLIPGKTETGKTSTINKDAAVLTRMLEEAGLRVHVRSMRNADDDVYLMYVAKTLFVHRGAFSALGALACTGAVYYTNAMEPYIKQNQFKWLLNNAKPAVDGHVLEGHEALHGMGSVVPSCCKFEPFGVGDGEKVICSNAKSFSRDACWVLSVGCGNKWSFENSIISKTRCKVHTFDCTGDFKVPSNLRDRVTVHKICLGQEKEKRKMFMSWNKIIELGSSLSGVGGNKLPAIAKMDIEGHEFPVLKSLVEDGKESMLPEQLALEVHTSTIHDVGPPFFKAKPTDRTATLRKEDVGSLFQNLSTREYKLVHRADNPFCRHCSEVTLVRTVGIPSVE